VCLRAAQKIDHFYSAGIYVDGNEMRADSHLSRYFEELLCHHWGMFFVLPELPSALSPLFGERIY